MGDAWEREIYEELYAIRARVESFDSYMREIISELMKIRKLMEEEKAGKSGRGP
jgi:hypothetical protein